MPRVWLLVAIQLLPQQSAGLKTARLHDTGGVDTLRGRAEWCPPEEDGRVNNIYYINVDSQTFRRKYMEDMLLNKSLVDECVGIHRLSAVEPNDVFDGWAAKKYAPNGCAWNRTVKGPKRCGNDITHRIGFKQCAGHKGFCLVLEDDALIRNGWHDTFLNELGDVPNDWTMIRLGSGGPRDEIDRVAGTNWFHCNRHVHHKYFGSFAIILDAKRAKNLLHFIHDKKTKTADAWTALPGTYIYETNLITRAPLTSNINTDGESTWGTDDGSEPDLSDVEWDNGRGKVGGKTSRKRASGEPTTAQFHTFRTSSSSASGE